MSVGQIQSRGVSIPNASTVLWSLNFWLCICCISYRSCCIMIHACTFFVVLGASLSPALVFSSWCSRSSGLQVWSELVHASSVFHLYSVSLQTSAPLVLSNVTRWTNSRSSSRFQMKGEATMKKVTSSVPWVLLRTSKQLYIGVSWGVVISPMLLLKYS